MGAVATAEPTPILFVENSIGLSGSTMSLGTLLEHLDPAAVRPHVVLSRPEQLAYLARRLPAPAAADLRLIAPAPRLRSRPALRGPLAALARRAPRLHRAAQRALGAVDLVGDVLRYAPALYRHGRARGVRLVHQNNGFDVGAVVAARLLGVPLVAYQRGDEWNSASVRRVARGVRQWIANSRATHASLLDLGIPPERISVIHPPVDTEALAAEAASPLTRAALGLPAEGPAIGMVGMLLPWKGQDVFLRALAVVLRRHPTACGVVVGGAPESGDDFERELHRLARTLGIGSRVVFTGFRTDVPAVLRCLDVVVHASVTPEPFGRVIVEAMAMGLPVVAAGAGGPTEIIEDGRTGLLSPPADAGALADRLIELIDHPARARAMGQAARADACLRFGAPQHARAVAEVYARALGAAGAAGATGSPARGRARAE